MKIIYYCVLFCMLSGFSVSLWGARDHVRYIRRSKNDTNQIERERPKDTVRRDIGSMFLGLAFCSMGGGIILSAEDIRSYLGYDQSDDAILLGVRGLGSVVSLYGIQSVVRNIYRLQANKQEI